MSSRAELEGAIDLYLDALAANDPSRLPLTPDAVFAENYQRLPLGEGTWATITGLGSYRHYFTDTDTDTDTAGAICTVRENGAPALLDLRLQLKDGKIAEIDSFIIRDALAGVRYEEELKALEPVWFEPAPPEERLGREALIAAVDKYFQSMERCDGRGDYSFFDRECDRIEHALQTTNVKKPMAYGHSHDTDFASMTAEEQWKTGFLGFVTEIRDRRFVVVDVERQVAFCFVTLDHNGTVRVLHQTTGKDFIVPPYFDVPRTLQVMEAFKVRRGKLFRVEMTLTELPYGMRPPRALPPPKARSPGRPAGRADLERLIHETLAAMKAHDPAGLPLAPTVRYTENGQALTIGDGLWGTLTGYASHGEGAPEYRLILADEERGEAAFLGGILEESTQGMLFLRLRVSDGGVSEIEAVAIRHEYMGDRGGTVTLFQPRLLADFDPSAFKAPAHAFLGDTTPAERSALEAAAEAWFDAVELDSSSGVPLAADAIRRDNGHAPGPDAPPLDADIPAYRPLALGPAALVDSGYFKRLSKVRDRRHLADPALGLVITVAVQDNPGRVKSIEVPGVGQVKLPGLRTRPPGAEINRSPDEDPQLFGARLTPNVLVPTSELVVQVIKLENGRIARIETLSRGGPYGLTTGWVD